MLSVVIVDDEAPARDELRYLLESFPEIRVVGEADCGREALAVIRKLQPRVVFLDVQMPDMSGLTVARELTGYPFSKRPIVVFATAFDEYAIKAFEVNAVDYLLKPYTETRLEKAVARVRELADQGGQAIPWEKILELADSKQATKPGPERITVERQGKLYLLSRDEIIFATVSGRNTVVKTARGEFYFDGILSELEARLPAESFIRTHKSFIVNINQIEEIQPWFNNTYNVLMKDQGHSEIPVSRTYVKHFREQLGI